MNKLPWFTHANDAGEDEYHQNLMDQFGTSGYGMLWLLTENFDRHGVGEWWETTWAFVCRKLRTKPARARQLLDSCQAAGKIAWEEDGQVLRISLKNFRKIQSKLKGKTPPKLLQNSPNRLEREREGEREGERPSPSSPAARGSSGHMHEPHYSKQFEVFWKEYPKKVAKVIAYQQWKRLKLDAQLTAVLSGLKKYKLTGEVQRGFILDPERWIKRMRWTDEHAATSNSEIDDLKDALRKTRRIL